MEAASPKFQKNSARIHDVTSQNTVFFKIYKSIILAVILYPFEKWFLRQREEHGCRVFENGALRAGFGLEREEVTGGLENYIMRSFIT
jgi:hypothetical protein